MAEYDTTVHQYNLRIKLAGAYVATNSVVAPWPVGTTRTITIAQTPGRCTLYVNGTELLHADAPAGTPAGKPALSINAHAGAEADFSISNFHAEAP